VRYVHLPGAAVDTALLEDATRRGTPRATPSIQEATTLTRSHHRSCVTGVKGSMTPVYI